jgi:hypothetical protein
LAVLVFTSVQLAPHSCWFDWQLLPHTPFEQTRPCPHALPQVPQFLGSSATLTQLPPQGLSGARQVQAPFVQF